MTVEEYYAAVIDRLDQIVEYLTSLSGLENIAIALQDSTVLLFQFIVIAGLVALAYWKGHTMLYIAAAMGLIIVGWQWEWHVMVPLVLVAVYTLYRALRPWLPW